MRLRPSSLSSAKGMTLVELLLALAVGVIVLGLAFSITLSNRRLYQLDQSRTALNQNLRTAMDMIGADVRQAGERMPQDFTPVEVIDAGSSDTLVLRRSLLDVVLPICETINSGSNEDNINVARKVNPPNAACTFDDSNGNGRDDGIDRWNEFRCNQDGVAACQGNSQETLRAYVYNPATRQGEWIVYDAEDNSGVKIHKANAERWLYTYRVDDNPRIYVLEERLYRLQGGFLQLVINGDTANPHNVIDRVTAFSVRALMQDGTWRTAMGPSDPWTTIASLEVGLTGRTQFSGRDLERSLTSHFMPRNILSF